MRKHADEIRKVLEQHEFDNQTKVALVDYFEYSAQRYSNLRRALIIFAIIISLGCAFGIQQSYKTGSDAKSAVEAVKTEGVQRRDQTCAISEREAAQNITQLVSTYRYLESLTPQESKQSLNQAILRQLPQTELKARVSVAPKFCDEKGVGLPEPGPKVPPKKDFSKLLVHKQ